MSTAAIILMVLAIVIIWGGLAVAVRFLVTHPVPDPDDGEGYSGSTRRRRT